MPAEKNTQSDNMPRHDLIPVEEHLKEPAAELQREVEERKRTEAKLKQSEERLKFALEAAEDGIWDWNIAEERSYWSPGYYIMLGYKPNEVPASSETFTEWLHPYDREQTLQRLKVCLATGDEYRAEFRLRSKAGDWRWIFSRGKVVEWDAAHKPQRMVGTHVDISKRKQAEEALQHAYQELQQTQAQLIQNESRFRLISELISDYAYVFQVTDGGRFSREWVTDAFCRITGYTLEELDEFGSWLPLAHPEDRERVRQHQQTVLAGSTVVTEYRIITKHGEQFWLRDYSRPVLDATRKNVIRIVGAAQNISRQKQAEEERQQLEEQHRQAQRLEALGTLAGGIAHDFNNLLGTILGYTELVLQKLPGHDALHEYLTSVYQAGERASDLVRQILTFSRAQDLPTPVPTDVVPILQEVVTMLRAATPPNITIQQDISPNCRSISANPSQINQVLMNVCINAVHAMHPHGGTLTLALKEKTPATEPSSSSPSYLQLDVRDTGTGIPPEVQERMFEPFFSTKKIGEGAGLGLAAVHGIVTAHHGTITVKSSPGQGTTFTLMFPIVHETQHMEPSDTTAEFASPQKGRILLVEDEEKLCRLYATALEAVGYQLTSCRNGEEALEQFLSAPQSFDLVISDRVMPGISGSQLSRELLQHRPELPIILISGYSDINLDGAALPREIRYVMAKPFALRTLIERVGHILHNAT